MVNGQRVVCPLTVVHGALIRVQWWVGGVGIKGCRDHKEAKPILLSKFGKDNIPNAGGGEYEIILRSIS